MQDVVSMGGYESLEVFHEMQRDIRYYLKYIALLENVLKSHNIQIPGCED